MHSSYAYIRHSFRADSINPIYKFGSSTSKDRGREEGKILGLVVDKILGWSMHTSICFRKGKQDLHLPVRLYRPVLETL